jgi:hypothetical protein
MGGTPHWRRGHLAWLQAAARTSAAERERCTEIVERWNAAPTHNWSPAIGTALKAGYRWLDVYCAGCGQVKPIDLASVDIHPQAGLTSLILMLRCRQCAGYGPLPRLIGRCSTDARQCGSTLSTVYRLAPGGVRGFRDPGANCSPCGGLLALESIGLPVLVGLPPWPTLPAPDPWLVPPVVV